MSTSHLSSIRPSLRDHHRPSSGSPHTPTRFVPSSTYSSPGGTSFRNEDDAIIIELDPRQLLAGFEGESSPHCVVRFTPHGCHRVGDFRDYIPGARKRKIHKDIDSWSEGYELWRNDISCLDLGLLEDKLERVFRDVYNTYLLTDVGSARLVLVLPSLVAHPVLDSILTLLFERWKYAGISLLPKPTMEVVGAGLRSGLVVDIGWEETTVTSIYEYRELKALRTVRGMKLLVRNVGEYLKNVVAGLNGNERKDLRFDFDFVEEFVGKVFSGGLLGEDENGGRETSQPGQQAGRSVEVDWPTANSWRLVEISRKALHQVLNKTFMGDDSHGHADDHEHPLAVVMYRSLQYLPPDIRGICMSRVIFTGPGANLCGLDQKIMNNVKSTISQYGWSAVRGEKAASIYAALAQMTQTRTTSVDARAVRPLSPGDDPVEVRLNKFKDTTRKAAEQGTLRQVSSLGAWAGASLLTSSKVKSVVEIEREKFLSLGVSGAQREVDVTSVPQRTSALTLGGIKSNERASWTLAGWG